MMTILSFPKWKYRFACTLLFLISGLVSFNAYSIETSHKQANLDVEEKVRKKSGGIKAGYNGRPRLTKSAVFVMAVEKKLIKGIDKLLADLRSTLRRLPKGARQRLQILDRIHNLNLEQAAYVASQENRVYDANWEKWDAGGRKGREPKLDDRKSKRYWSLVARSAANFLKEFPKAPGADQVNLNQAMALLFLGRDKSAARAFSALIKKYPNSRVAGDAYFALGDYYFENANFNSAITNYRSALKYRQSKRYGWALFKLAWSYYNLGQYRRALASWKKTVSYSKISPENGGKQLKEEALRDMVYAFAELKQVEPAITYFRVNGGDKYIGQFLTLLAQTFTDQGQYAKAITTWKRLQKVAPRADEAYTAQVEIVSLAYELGKYKTLWKELSVFPRRYGKGSGWAAGKPKQQVIETHLEIRDSAIYYPKIIHKKAQKGAKRLFGLAVIGYKLFLKLYPTSRQVVEAKFNLADIEYARKKYRDAGRLYMEITRLGPKKAIIYDDKTGKPIQNIHQTAGKYMLDSYYSDFKPELKNLEKVKPDPKKPPRPLSAKALNFIKGCNMYLKSYPKDQKVARSCHITVADTYYKFNVTKKAIQALRNVALKYAKSKAGPKAVDSLLPLLKNNEQQLVQLVNQLLAIPEYRKGRLGKLLRGVLQDTEVKAIVNEGDARKRALSWVAHAKKYPSGAGADRSWYNAAVDFLKAGMVTNAIAAYTTIVNKYPKSEQVKESILQLAKINDKRFQFSVAAKYYTLFAQKYRKDNDAAGAIERACYLQIAVNPQAALSVCTRLAAINKSAATDAFLQLMDAFYFAGDLTAMSRVIRGNLLGKLPLSSSQKVIVSYRLYEAGGKSNALAANILRQFQQDPKSIEGEAIRYVGEIVFNRNRGSIGPALGANLKGGTVNALQQSMVVKEGQIGKLVSAMDNVVNTQDPYWGVAAIYFKGLAMLDMYQKLSNPPNINGAKQEDVKKQLAQNANQFLQGAQGFFKTAVELADKFNVLSPYTAKLANSIISLKNPGKSFDSFVITPDILGGEVPPRVAGRL